MAIQTENNKRAAVGPCGGGVRIPPPRGDEKRTHCPGDTLFLGDINPGQKSKQAVRENYKLDTTEKETIMLTSYVQRMEEDAQ
jgi:hypothetical protein